MKMLPVLSGLMMIVSITAFAQEEELAKAGEEACSCLKALDPEALTKTDLRIEMLGCMSNPVDGIAEALTKKGLWADSLTLPYLGKVGKEVRQRCPEELERLKKKEIVIDSTLIKIAPGAELVPGYSTAVCHCLGVSKDVEECIKHVGKVNKTEIQKHFAEDDFGAIMGLTMDVMFDLADHCDAAASHEGIANIRKYPSIKTDCDKLVLGEFKTETMFGETRSKFTATKLQEFTDGKLTAEYSLKWSGCTVTMKCTSSKSELVKKGQENTMEIKRASTEGFIGLISFGKMNVPAYYAKVK